MTKYYLTAVLGDSKIEKEVTKEQYCLAERAAGFYPKLASTHPDYMTTPATGAFGFGNVSGWVETKEDNK